MILLHARNPGASMGKKIKFNFIGLIEVQNHCKRPVIISLGKLFIKGSTNHKWFMYENGQTRLKTPKINI